MRDDIQRLLLFGEELCQRFLERRHHRFLCPQRLTVEPLAQQFEHAMRRLKPKIGHNQLFFQRLHQGRI